MGHDADLGDDKPTPDELTKTPLVNGYGYSLWNELTKLQRSNNNNNININRHREITKTLLDIYSSPKARFVAALIWELKAFTTYELVKLTRYSERVIDHTRKNLTRIGLLRSTIEIESPYGKRGPMPWVYAIGIANENDSVEAKLRYTELMKKKLKEDKIRKRESRRLAAEEVRRKAEARERQKGDVIQTLVTGFTGIYEEKKRPISLQDIDKKAKAQGLVDPNTLWEIAVKLERKDVETGYYVDGKLDPTWEPPPEILQARERREAER